MAAPYSSQTITGYNSNPPADDGSQVEANRVKWSTIKTKLNDPVKTRTDSMDTALIAAFGKVLGGAGITSTAINYTVLSADQGKLVRATEDAITITTPDATSVDDPFAFAVLNDSDGDITLDGSGSQTIDGYASIAIPSKGGLILFTDGTNWYSNGQNFQRTQIAPQGYLTLVPEATDPINPVPTSDQAAKTAVYYRPSRAGNLWPIPDGTNFSVKTFSEQTLTLNSNHVANGIYDVFGFTDNSGVDRIGTGPVWNTVTAGSGARGSGAGTTELQLLKGLPVNKNAITLRNGATTYSVSAKCAIFLGSIFIDATEGQVSCHVAYGQNRKWGVSNAYNRRRILMKAGDGTSSWNYSSATVRASNGESGNKITSFCCLPDTHIRASFNQKLDLSVSSVTGTMRIGIGVNSTTAFSGTIGEITVGAGSTALSGGSTVVAAHEIAPAIGIQNIQMLESTPATSGTETATGTELFMKMLVEYMG